MQVLVQRSQTELLSNAVFRLWVKFVLTPEEDTMLSRYKLRHAVITQSPFLLDVKRAMFYSALTLILLAFVILSYRLMTIGIMGLFETIPIVLFLALVPFPILSIILYFRIKERLTVNDMVQGRSFSCQNIAVLQEKKSF